MKKLLTLCLLLSLSICSSRATITITLGGSGNYNLLNGGSSVKYTVANSAANLTTSQINYGLTTNYGSTINNTNFNGPSSVVFTNELAGLQLGTVYHYSITSSDLNGPVVSPDAVLTNNAIGVVTYLALINYVRQSIGTNFNTNVYPYVVSNLNGLSVTNWSITSAALITPFITNVQSFNGDSVAGNQFSSIIATYNNVGYTPATSTVVTNSLYNIPTVNATGLFKFNLYEITTSSGTGNITNYIIWSDENGKHTNNLMTNNVGGLTTTNQSAGIYLHSTTNITLILSPGTISGSPVVNVFGSLERIQ